MLGALVIVGLPGKCFNRVLDRALAILVVETKIKSCATESTEIHPAMHTPSSKTGPRVNLDMLDPFRINSSCSSGLPTEMSRPTLSQGFLPGGGLFIPQRQRQTMVLLHPLSTSFELPEVIEAPCDASPTRPRQA